MCSYTYHLAWEYNDGPLLLFSPDLYNSRKQFFFPARQQRKYWSWWGDWEQKQRSGEFFDVERNGDIFNILIDKENAIEDKELSKALSDYGGIIINIYDKKVDEFILDAFVKQVKRYSHKNKIGITILIAEEISERVYDIVSNSKDKIINKIVLVEKSSITI